MAESKLALLGGKKAVNSDNKKLFKWPVITKEDEKAVLEVLRRGGMSGTDVTIQFEKEFAAWQGVKYALGCSCGTAALQSAMFGCKVGIGDEIICPSVTYWASGLPALSLGASVVFAEIDPQSLCIDPKDIEHRITDRTKAIVVVHYFGHPADMDPIMEIARKHNVKVIEDVSDALTDKYGLNRAETTNLLYNGGLRVYSTVDENLQSVMEKAMENGSQFFPQPGVKTTAVVYNEDGTKKTDENGNVVYFVNGEAADEDAFTAVINAQNEKADATFVPATAENLVLYLTIE